MGCSSRALIRIAIAVILLAISTGIIVYRRLDPAWRNSLYDAKLIPPTCTESGYTLYTNRENGRTYTDHIIPPAGHTFGPWQETASDATSTRSSRRCQVCGFTEEKIAYPDLSIPVLAIEGDLEGIGKKSEVNISVSLTGGEQELTSFATLKYQGHSSLSYDKKNYTLKLFLDENRTGKNKVSFSHWNPEHKYILKANYIDSSQCRNLVCADLWADVVASRTNIPRQLKNLSNYGAVDGFPVALYLNGDFQGIYTVNLHKDDDLFGMEDGRNQAIVIANTDTADEAFFLHEAAFTEESPWEVEFCGSSDDAWVKDKLNDFISFVMESDNETFRKNLSAYLDVDSAIDYLLSIYAMGLTRHGADELMLVCYGKNEPWIASMYDMETAFGLSADGTSQADPEEFLPGLENGRWNSDTGSLLWDRLLQNFLPEIQQRYLQLRQSVFDPQNMCSRVTDFISQIDPQLYAADHEVFPHPNPQIDHQEQITQYILRRIALLDEILLTETGV